MPRKNYDLNARPGEDAGAAARVINDDAALQEAQERTARIDRDTALADSGLTLSQVAAQAGGPITREDAASERAERALPAAGALRPASSGHQRKNLSAVKNTVERSAPKTVKTATRQIASTKAVRDGLNARLVETQSDKQKLAPKTRQLVSRVDRYINAQEAQRKGPVIAYVGLSDNTSASGLMDQAQRMASESDSGAIAADGYMTGSLDPAEIPGDGPLLEIRTRSGAYLGGSDQATARADYLIGRGRKLRPVSVGKATFTRRDGSTFTREVIQFDDVTPSPRSAARS